MSMGSMGHLERIGARPEPNHAPWTIPTQPMPRKPSLARRIGWVVAVVGLAGVAAAGLFRLLETHDEPDPERERDQVEAARELGGAAAVLAFSVLADSGLEHYRGAYHNPAMYVAPSAAAVSLINSVHMVLKPEVSSNGRLALSGLTLSTGLIGLAFHLTNVAKRDGGINLLNLFYGAPLLAPGAIAISGLAGLAAAQLVAEAEQGSPPTLLGRSAGTVVGLGAAISMLSTTAEAALLHFRGAFHDPFMYVPVTVPPVTALVLAAAVFEPRLHRAARLLLRVTAAAGVAGLGFHTHRVSRNMGGFYNWSQNILNGPPIPAPPSFTGVALAGLAAVRLMEAEGVRDSATATRPTMSSTNGTRRRGTTRPGR